MQIPTHPGTFRATSVFVGLVLTGLAACASSTADSSRRDTMVLAVSEVARISHDVFFTFANPTEGDIDGLITACERLRVLPGVLHLTAGRRDPAQTRDVNETTFHVALHVEFADQAAYDGYSPHPIHQALVKEFIPKTSAVVVYDALLGEP